eukprot:TRINITY_DN15918_c0_g1_i2.p1 TRINITY_DN15918_c0_g1~~TRINITY_DN15918_c0_g1_i2.p1  ORF type:complete len:309 (+),score=60.09 TRINITY_DN15918_c0_g1_i2:195-1121(+)
MANTKEGTVRIAGAGTSPEGNKKLYDNWGDKCEEDVRAWGYCMPEECAEKLKKFAPMGREDTYKILDAGAGDGLSGKAIQRQGFKEIVGIDLSPELIKIASKKDVYKKAEVADLSKPLKYKTDEFDALTVVGVMTYLEHDGCALDEMIRVVKTGGLIILTHRTDKVDLWKPKQDQLEKDGKLERLEITEPRPYLPDNPEYADKIKVIIHVWRVGKKDSVDMKVTNKKGTGFYVKSAKSFFQGTEDKDPVSKLSISGLGDAIDTAVAAAMACEQEGLCTIAEIRTSYPDMQSGGTTRGCGAIMITLKKK